MIYLKTNPVGIDVVINDIQLSIANALLWTDYDAYSRAYKNYTETGIIPEVYGITKGSSVVFEGIQYGKPLVVPEKFNMIKELKSSTLKYTGSKDLEKMLIEYIESREKLEELKREAYKNSKYFSLNVLQEYFINEILNKLDNL